MLKFRLIGQRERDEKEKEEADQQKFLTEFHKLFPHHKGEDCFSIGPEEKTFFADWWHAHPTCRYFKRMYSDRLETMIRWRLRSDLNVVKMFTEYRGPELLVFKHTEGRDIGIRVGDHAIHHISAGNQEMIQDIESRIDAACSDADELCKVREEARVLRDDNERLSAELDELKISLQSTEHDPSGVDQFKAFKGMLEANRHMRELGGLEPLQAQIMKQQQTQQMEMRRLQALQSGLDGFLK